jgi:hypothetical protein
MTRHSEIPITLGTRINTSSQDKVKKKCNYLLTVSSIEAISLSTMKNNSTLIVHQSYPVSQPINGVRSWRIAFLCPFRGVVEIFRDVRVVSDEFEQAALVREQIAAFRNS